MWRNPLLDLVSIEHEGAIGVQAQHRCAGLHKVSRKAARPTHAVDIASHATAAERASVLPQPVSQNPDAYMSPTAPVGKGVRVTGAQPQWINEARRVVPHIRVP